MTEQCELDKIFGVRTDEEWNAYLKVRRIRTSWDVAGYLAWSTSPQFMSWEEAEEYEYDGDGPEKVTKSEFLFMCEYVEELFSTETTLFELMDEAHLVVLNVRKEDFRGLDYTTRKIVERTIMLDRYDVIREDN